MFVPRINAAQSGMLVTTSILLLLVGMPLAYVFLQAIFPDIDLGSFSQPFSLFIPTLHGLELLKLIWNTLSCRLLS